MTKNSLVPSLSSMSSVTVILFTRLIVLGFEEEATAGHQLSTASYFDTTTGIIIILAAIAQAHIRCRALQPL